MSIFLIQEPFESTKDRQHSDFYSLRRSSHRNPGIDVYDDGETYTVHCELPGVRKEDISLQIHDQKLLLEATSKSEPEANKDQLKYSERRFGKLSRVITLPDQVDSTKIQASLDFGILKVKVPKAEDRLPKKISIA